MTLFNHRNRRSIRLKGFDYSSDGAYFLTICVQNRECLFGEIQKEKMILNDYGKIVREIWEDLLTTIVDIDLDEYVIMPNHFHAILVIDKSLESTNFYGSLNVNNDKERRKMILSKVVGKFKMLTAKAINQMRGNEGKFWQRNYYETVIRSEEDLNRIREYIINNPMQWELDDNHPNYMLTNCRRGYGQS
ncbi:MAG: transposase [Snowella sp.]|jgi:putative transposase|nr:MAG: transposase [Snowella sp.]